jgi:anti-repressor protein
MTTHQLIPIQTAPINGEDVQTVDARTLWAFLEIKADFSTWIKTQIDRLRLDEGYEYSILKWNNPGQRGKPRTDYLLTIYAAKHIAMLSDTPKGHQARAYFIECEARLKGLIATPQPQPQTYALPDFTDPAEAAIAWATQYRLGKDAEAKALALEQKVAEQEPIVQAVEAYAVQEGELCMRDAAKRLGIPPKLHSHRWGLASWCRVEAMGSGEQCDGMLSLTSVGRLLFVIWTRRIPIGS